MSEADPTDKPQPAGGEVTAGVEKRQTEEKAKRDAEEKEKRERTKRRNKIKAIAITSAFVGMVIGAVVEMFVQGAMESTGWFGPTLESVMSEQVANFDAIKKKLDALNAATTEADRERLRKELDELLKRQQVLTGQTHTELRRAQGEVETLREKSLTVTGSAGGADLWLKPGESVTVGSRENVFSLLSVESSHRARVNISGKSSLLSPGDFVEAPTADGVWKVFYKQSSRGGDRSELGFDLVAPSAK
jgi:hypothetical protein